MRRIRPRSRTGSSTISRIERTRFAAGMPPAPRGAEARETPGLHFLPTRNKFWALRMTLRRSFASTGEDQPAPGKARFQATFSVELHRTGTSFAGECPCPVGPRNSGQSCAHRVSTTALAKKMKTVLAAARFMDNFCCVQFISDDLNSAGPGAKRVVRSPIHR